MIMNISNQMEGFRPEGVVESGEGIVGWSPSGSDCDSNGAACGASGSSAFSAWSPIEAGSRKEVEEPDSSAEADSSSMACMSTWTERRRKDLTGIATLCSCFSNSVEVLIWKRNRKKKEKKKENLLPRIGKNLKQKQT